jgi:hypothetical protein
MGSLAGMPPRDGRHTPLYELCVFGRMPNQLVAPRAFAATRGPADAVRNVSLHFRSQSRLSALECNGRLRR